MRIAALYDIHANLPALEAVLADVRDAYVDRVIIGGDALPGPMPRQTLDLLYSLEVPTDFIIGNGDRETAVAARGPVSAIIPEFFRAAMKWNAEQIGAEDLARIDSWPLIHELSIDGIGRVIFCHATPRNDTEIILETTSENKLRPIFDPLGVQLVVCGHTHIQFDRMVGRTRLINAGSVGMPFQEAGAYWALIGADVELRRTRYDLDAAAARVRSTAYPLSDQAAQGIVTPPGEQATLEQFKKAELKN